MPRTGAQSRTWRRTRQRSIPGRAERKGRISTDGKRCRVAAMSGATLHIVFDIAAWLAAGTAAVWLSRAMRLRFPTQSFALPYIAALVFGAGLGAYLFGTLNLW